MPGSLVVAHLLNVVDEVAHTGRCSNGRCRTFGRLTQSPLYLQQVSRDGSTEHLVRLQDLPPTFEPLLFGLLGRGSAHDHNPCTERRQCQHHHHNEAKDEAAGLQVTSGGVDHKPDDYQHAQHSAQHDHSNAETTAAIHLESHVAPKFSEPGSPRHTS